MFSVGMGAFYSVIALVNSDTAHTVASESYEHIYGTLELPYPSITICPLQFSDRWNLQRELLNEIDLFDSDGLLRQKELGNFSVIFRTLLSKKWVHGNAIESLTNDERRIVQQVLPLTLLNDEEGEHFSQ